LRRFLNLPSGKPRKLAALLHKRVSWLACNRARQSYSPN